MRGLQLLAGTFSATARRFRGRRTRTSLRSAARYTEPVTALPPSTCPICAAGLEWAMPPRVVTPTSPLSPTVRASRQLTAGRNTGTRPTATRSQSLGASYRVVADLHRPKAAVGAVTRRALAVRTAAPATQT